MTEHYFNTSPKARHEYRQFRFIARNHEFTFMTDAGVFSKEHVDTGTSVLVRHVPLEGARRVLDLGCGYGVIGIVAATFLPAADVFLADPNERAIELAKQNIRLNRLSNAFAICSDGFSGLGNRTFDLVLTNPPIRTGKQTMYRLFSEAHGRLENGGRLVVVIRTNQGARSTEEYLTGTFSRVDELERESGFRLYQAVK